MKTIKITLTDEEYVELMQAVNLVHADAQSHARDTLLCPAKTIITVWCKLNLLRNAEKFAKAVKMK